MAAGSCPGRGEAGACRGGRAVGLPILTRLSVAWPTSLITAGPQSSPCWSGRRAPPTSANPVLAPFVAWASAVSALVVPLVIRTWLDAPRDGERRHVELERPDTGAHVVAPIADPSGPEGGVAPRGHDGRGVLPRQFRSHQRDCLAPAVGSLSVASPGSARDPPMRARK